MQISSNKKIIILIIATICMAFYLLVGLDFEIFQYQFQSRLRKLILILIVGGAIGASVVIFQAITTNRLLTPSIMGLDSVYLFVKVLPVFSWYTSRSGYKCVFKLFVTLIAMVLFSLLLLKACLN